MKSSFKKNVSSSALSSGKTEITYKDDNKIYFGNSDLDLIFGNNFKKGTLILL